MDDVLEVTDFIDRIIKENRESWKQEFLNTFKTYEERKAALASLIAEYNTIWREQFGKPIGNTFPPGWMDPGLVDAIKKYNANWWNDLHVPIKRGDYSGDFDYKKYHTKGQYEFDTEKWKKELSMGKYHNGNGDNYVKDSKYGNLVIKPYHPLKKEREKWYNAKYLPGDDFNKSFYARYTSDQILDQIKKSWLVDVLSGKNHWAKDLKNSVGSFYKAMARNEKEEWKKGINNSIENAKHRGLSALHSVIAPLDPRPYFERMKTTIGNEISNTLGAIRNESLDLLNNTVNDVIDNLQDMGSRFITGVKVKALDYAAKTGQALINKAKNYLGPIANKLTSVIPAGVKSFLSPVSGIISRNLGRLASSLNLGNLFGGWAANTVTSVPARLSTNDKHIENLYNRSFMFKGMTAAKSAEWDQVNLLSIGENLRDIVRIIIEDSGWITDPIKSVILSRESLFINRPYLESDVGGLYRSFVFFTRPNCNLFREGRIIADLKHYPEFFARLGTDPQLYQELCRDGAHKSVCWRLLSNYCKEVPPIRNSETSREGIKNMHERSMPLPGIPEIYDTYDISITFMDNNRGDISKLMYALSMYKDLVGKQEWPMRNEYILHRAIDYLMSMYIVTIDSNWNLISLACAKNLIIAEPPTHFAQHKIDGFSKAELLEDFQVNFKATSWIADAPHLIEDFNRLFGFDMSNIVDPRGAEGITLMHDNRANEKFEKRIIIPVLFAPPGEVFGKITYPGISEHIALAPGIYRVPAKKSENGNITDTRPRLKFGFSW